MQERRGGRVGWEGARQGGQDRKPTNHFGWPAKKSCKVAAVLKLGVPF